MYECFLLWKRLAVNKKPISTEDAKDNAKFYQSLLRAVTDVQASTCAFSVLIITNSTDRRAGFYQCFLGLGYY